MNDLDVGEIRTTVAEAVRRGRLTDPGTTKPVELLRGMGLLLDGVLSRAAAVLFGKAERLEFAMPQCSLLVARFRGFDRTEFLDNRQFNGNAFSLLASGERFLRDSLQIAGRIVDTRIERIDKPLYPPMATREALANAFCHRDYTIGGGSVGLAIYDDRLEVTSSGALHFGLTPEKLFQPHEALPWNPPIARSVYRRGIIDERGRGTLKMAELAIRAGLPPLEIADGGGSVTVSFRNGKLGSNLRGRIDMVNWQKCVLALLERADEGLTFREIHARLAEYSSERQVRRALVELKARGLVASTRGRAARWRLVRG